MPEQAADVPGAQDVESVDLAEQITRIQAARDQGATPPAGRLLGLPELPGDDVWVDAAGASAITGMKPNRITDYVKYGKPKSNPFPQPHRILYRNFWPLSELEAWTAEQRANIKS